MRSKRDELGVFTERFIEVTLKPIVIAVRAKYETLYDCAPGGDNQFHAGLCYHEAAEVKRLIEPYLQKVTEQVCDYRCDIVHGELRHTSQVASKYWMMEHTWLHIHLIHWDFYVDPTSSQFKDLFDDIPDYYVSTKPPKWYLMDWKNPRFHRLRWLDEHIRIPIRVNYGVPGEYHWYMYGCIQFLTFRVRGPISDIVHWIRQRFKKKGERA